MRYSSTRRCEPIKKESRAKLIDFKKMSTHIITFEATGFDITCIDCEKDSFVVADKEEYVHCPHCGTKIPIF